MKKNFSSMQNPPTSKEDSQMKLQSGQQPQQKRDEQFKNSQTDPRFLRSSKDLQQRNGERTERLQESSLDLQSQNLQKNASQDQNAEETMLRKISLAIKHLNDAENKAILLKLYIYLIKQTSSPPEEQKRLLQNEKNIQGVLSIAASSEHGDKFIIIFNTLNNLLRPQFTITKNMILGFAETQASEMREQITVDPCFFDFSSIPDGIEGDLSLVLRSFIEKIFKDEPTGTYLLRFSSSKPDTLVVTYKWQDEVKHMYFLFEEMPMLAKIKANLCEDFNKVNKFPQLRPDKIKGYLNQNTVFTNAWSQVRHEFSYQPSARLQP